MNVKQWIEKNGPLTIDQRQQRLNVRNFLYVATPAELQIELKISVEKQQPFREACVQELIDEQ